MSGLAGGSTLSLDLLDDVHTLGDLAEDDVVTIEPRARDGGDEELGAVGVGTSVGHGEAAGLLVAKLEGLIGELHAVDGLTTGTIASLRMGGSGERHTVKSPPWSMNSGMTRWKTQPL